MSECLFCKIANKEVPAKTVYENNSLFAIRDIRPQAPVHLLIIPKKHIATINDLKQTDAGVLDQLIFCAKELAIREKIEDGFRLVLNNGAKAGQSVFHIHLHLLGGRPMTWPPG